MAAPGKKAVNKDDNAKNVKKVGFAEGEKIVYPAHGVGKVKCIECTEAAGLQLEMYVIEFDKERLTLRVPVSRAVGAGMRKLASEQEMNKAFAVLGGKARVKRSMWSRRAQEYESKINSGDLIAVSEVVRDLYRSPGQSTPSYSERQIFEQARERLVREVAAVYNLTETAGQTRVESILNTEARAAGEKPPTKAANQDTANQDAANQDIAADQVTAPA